MTHSTGGGAGINAVLNTWLNKKWLADLMYDLQHQKFTAEAMIPGNMGNVARFMDWSPPARGTMYSGAAPTQFAEASTTANQITNLTSTATNVTVAEFGEHVRVGDLFELAAMGGTREKIKQRLNDGALITLDDVVRQEAHKSRTGYFAVTTAGGATSSQPATIGTAGAMALVTVKNALKQGFAMGISGVSGHPDKQYAAILTPTQEVNIVGEISTSRLYWSNAVVNVPGPMGQEKFVNGYIGSVYGVAVYITQNYATVTQTSSSWEVGYVYSRDAIATASLRQNVPEIIINDVNSPYKNVNSIAWHAYFGAAIVTSTDRVIKFYSAT